MIVREHVFVLSRCLFCRADRYSDEPTPECRERDDYMGKPCPEPALRSLACEDTATISARIAELDAERRQTWWCVPEPEPEPEIAAAEAGAFC